MVKNRDTLDLGGLMKERNMNTAGVVVKKKAAQGQRCKNWALLAMFFIELFF